MTLTPPPFTLSAPLDGASPILLASPHCGTHIPSSAAALLHAPLDALRRIEDTHVARLVAPAGAAIGAPLIAATHSRIVIDLNRAETEYDPALLHGRLPVPPAASDRVRRGYGLIPRIAGGTGPIHARAIPAAEAWHRIETLHRPWHRAINDGLAAARARHGHALLIDCHSMPRLDGAHPAELVIGDRHGRSAHPGITDAAMAIFADLGLRTARNHPYAGGYNTTQHGRPDRHIHAIQLEFCRSIYMDQTTRLPGPRFAALSALIAQALARLADTLPAILRPDDLPMAAE